MKIPDPITYEKYRQFLRKKEVLFAIQKESSGSFDVFLKGYISFVKILCIFDFFKSKCNIYK